MNQTSIAAAADYADSLLVARRTKTVLFLLLLFALVAQLTLFFVVRYGHPQLLEAAASRRDQYTKDALQYVIGLLDFAGLILPAMLVVCLLIILLVQLVGRLLGTAGMTSALLSSVLLALLLFPWQAVLNNPAITDDPVANSIGMKIPGVLYTWAEFSHSDAPATFKVVYEWGNWWLILLRWSRYVGFPVIAVLLLLWIQFKSDRSLRQSLGEEIALPATTTA
jgi:hypothetical protein